MRYALYWTWNDGIEDSGICEDREERDISIKDMISRNEFKEISYCKIYANGEYGMHVTVLKEGRKI